MRIIYAQKLLVQGWLLQLNYPLMHIIILLDVCANKFCKHGPGEAAGSNKVSSQGGSGSVTTC